MELAILIAGVSALYQILSGVLWGAGAPLWAALTWPVTWPFQLGRYAGEALSAPRVPVEEQATRVRAIR